MASLAEDIDRLYAERLRALYRLAGSIVVQGEGGVLLCLRRAERPMLSGELVERMGLTTGRMANILKQLEAKGLIVRSQDRLDRRKVHVSLSEAGLAQAAAQDREAADARRALLDYLGEPDARELVRIVARCLTYYQEH